jgi:hypothetical protein
MKKGACGMKRVSRWLMVAIVVNCYAYFVVADHQVLELQSTMLHAVDGNFLNADTLERVFSFKREVINIMWGAKDASGNIAGRYSFCGGLYGADELAKKEQLQKSLTANKEFSQALQRMKKDFLKASDKLKAIARGAKPAMGILIEESCARRQRMDSVLLLWAHTPEEEEDPIFDEKVKTVSDFTRFCFDLLDFIEDLLHSCPKARKLFEVRLEKWKKVEAILSSIMTEKPDINFLINIKTNHLDKWTLDQISADLLTRLLKTSKTAR